MSLARALATTALVVAAGGGSGASAFETACLVHAGPEDKSMPAICLVQGARSEADPFRIESPASPEARAALDALLAETAGEPACQSGAFGVYRLEGSTTVVCGPRLRRFVERLASLDDAEALRALLRRLP